MTKVELENGKEASGGHTLIMVYKPSEWGHEANCAWIEPIYLTFEAKWGIIGPVLEHILSK